MKAVLTALYAVAMIPVFVLCVISLGVVLLCSKEAREKWFSDRRHKTD